MKTLYMVLGILFVLPMASIAQGLDELDEIAPFSDGLAAVRKGNQWGFINQEGTLVIDFRNDIHWKKDADTSKSDVTGVRSPMFHGGRCLIVKKVEDGVPLYGFIDTSGNTVIEPMFLNVYPFKEGLTTGVLFDKVLRGKNEFKLNIYDFRFFDVLVDDTGEIKEYFEPRQNIQMTRKRYTLPYIGAKKLTDALVAVYVKEKGWEIRKLSQKKDSDATSKG